MDVLPPFGQDTVLHDGPEQPLPPAPVVTTNEPACPGVPADPPMEPLTPADPPFPVGGEGFCRSETSACPQLDPPRAATMKIARIPHEHAESCDMATNAPLGANRSRGVGLSASAGSTI